MKAHDEIMGEWDAARVAIAAGDTSSRPRDWLEDVLGERDARIEELEIAIRAALSFVQGRHADPNDGHARMVIAALRGALAKP